MKWIQRGMALCLSGALLFSLTAPAFAQETGEPSEKEEVVYTTLEADGSPQNTYVVNRFSGGTITDYGNYTEVKPLNTEDPIEKDGDRISFTSTADQVYYQGTLAEAQLPWEVTLTYFLDGEEISPESLGGSTGALEIHFQVEKNPACEGDFFEDYALQASFTLDTELCESIKAPDATVANVGGDKQLTYTILPGEGIDTVISAQVRNFQMDPVSLNGIRLNLSVDVDDASIRDKVGELMDAVDQLDQGAVALSSGSEELKGGSSQVKDGASSLHSGVTQLDEGVVSLQSGLDTVQQGLDSLAGQSTALASGSNQFQTALQTMQLAVNSLRVTGEDLSELVTTSETVRQAIEDLSAGAAALQESLGVAQYKAVLAQNGLDVDALQAQNANGVETLTSYEALLEQICAIPGVEEMASPYKEQLLETAEQLKALLNANSAAIQGTETYLETASAQLSALTQGLQNLESQYASFDSAITELVGTLGNMTGNLSILASGIDQLAEEYGSLDQGIHAYTDGVDQLAQGYSQVMEGMSSLAEGSKALVSGSGSLYDGTVDLYDGVISLCDGAQEMASGTGEFQQEVPAMKETLEDKIDTLMASLGGEEGDVESFVSPKNTQVDSVQFVIQTSSIEREEPDPQPQQSQASPTFWEKLTDLFS